MYIVPSYFCPLRAGRHKEIRVADPRGLRHAQRVRGRGPGHDGLLSREPRQLSTGSDPRELGHHSADHARRPAARVVLADRVQVGQRFAVLHAPDPGARGHAIGSQRSDFRGMYPSLRYAPAAKCDKQ